jgi:hypothetical protein
MLMVSLYASEIFLFGQLHHHYMWLTHLAVTIVSITLHAAWNIVFVAERPDWTNMLIRTTL